MNRNYALSFPGPPVAFAGQVPWINPATRQVEWINQPLVDDLLGPSIGSGGFGFTTTLLNSATATLGGNTAGHPGVVSLATAALSNGAATLRTVSNSQSGPSPTGTIKHRLLFCFQTPASLSDGTDQYELWLGWGNSTGSKPTNGLFLDYIHSLNSGNWTPTVGNGGAYTTASGGSSVAVAVSTWYWCYVEYDGASAKFWIATDVAGKPGLPGPFTFLGQCTTNLPQANQYGMSYVIAKSLGTNSRVLTMDKVLVSV